MNELLMSGQVSEGDLWAQAWHEHLGSLTTGLGDLLPPRQTSKN